MSPRVEVFQGTDRFSVVRVVGTGGMGVVYEVFDRERRRAVALKTLRDLDATSLYRFKHEFRALADIAHPNLIPLYELFADEQHWYFTMELVEGATDFLSYVRQDLPRREISSETATETVVGESVAASVLPPSAIGGPAAGSRPGGQDALPGAVDAGRLRALLAQLADAVATLHESGKLHRDLKPRNVLVRPDGHVFVVDLGLVADLSQQPPERGSSSSSSGSGVRVSSVSGASGSGSGSQARVRSYHSTDRKFAGTVAYMSPEQAARAPLTPASDWYALGVMLFQALTGRLPFEGITAQVMREKQEIDAPRVRDFAPGAPDDLVTLCERLLRREASARPTAPDVLELLGVSRARPLRVAGQLVDDLPFVGRTSQLAALDQAFEAVGAGSPVICRVQGRSGAGKSTLLARFLVDIEARSDAVVLTGRCYEQESVPFKAVDSLIDALTRYLMTLGRDDLQALTPRRTSELTRMFPVLARVETFAGAPEETQGTTIDPREVRRVATEALREILAGIAARGPLVLYADDVQWGDADSAVLLRELLVPQGAPPLLLLLAYRSEYASTSPFLRTIASQDAGGPQVEVSVDALAPEDARTLALALLDESRADREADADWVARESGGSALFVHELVEHLRAGGTTAAEAGADLDGVLWSRVQQLPEATRRLVEVVAVAGRPVRLDDAQAAAHLPAVPPDMLATLRAGRFVRTMRVSASDDQIEIFHDRVRESIIARLAPEALRHHHAGLAVALELAGAADPETIAVHLEGGGDTARAGLYFGRAAENAVRVLAFDRAASLFRRAASLVADSDERARIHERMIHFFTDMAHFSDAYAVGRTAVADFGIRLPASFVPPLFAIDFLRSKWRLRGRSVDDLLELPLSTDTRHVAAVRLMSAMAKAAYQVRPELCVAVATRIVNECQVHGNTHDCAIGYMVFGAIFQGGVLGRHRAGYDFGQLALSLVERYANHQQRAEVCFVVGYFGTSWMRPATEAEALWQRAFDAGLASGDLFHTGCASAGTVMSFHMRGVPMPDVERECNRFLEVLDRARLREPAGVVRVVRQVVRNLSGLTAAPDTLSDDEFDEEAYVRSLDGYGSRHFAHFYFVARMQLAYLRGDLERAAALAARSATYLKDSPGMLHAAEHHYLSGLIDAARGRAAGARRAERRLRRWAADSPANFAHKWWLMKGELARLRGRQDEALDAFDHARSAAQTYGYLQVEALADVLTAEVHQSRGATAGRDDARARAAGAFARWGTRAEGLGPYCSSSQASSGAK